ncbi:MAG: response regulator transcription factor [Verrucomicrobiota bacterium]
MKKHRIRLLVVDDHFFVRMGLTGSLNGEPDMRVVAEADNGGQAIQMYREHKPDLVIMDGRLPGMSGVETLTALRREFPNVRVLMLSIDEGEEDVYRAMQGGACGYLPKATQLQELLRAIRAIHAGERYLPPALAARLQERGPDATLTAREREVLELASKGLTNREIGEAIGCSDTTAKWHLKNIMQKLEVTDRTEATRVAVERGILHVE